MFAGGQLHTLRPAVTVRTPADFCLEEVATIAHFASSELKLNAAYLCAAYYSCALNSFVHVLMYTHYLLAAMLGKNMKARRKYLWWSRYLTQFQMFQFVTMMIQVRS